MAARTGFSLAGTGAVVAAVIAWRAVAWAGPASPFAPPPKPTPEASAEAGRGGGGGSPAETRPEADAYRLPPPEVRAVRGRLTPPDRVLEAHLVERMLEVTVPLRVDKTTGRFEARGLRLGTYCLVVRTPWGRLEGVDLVPRLSPYDALIPPRYRTEEIGLVPRGPFTEEDRQAILRHVREVKRYENKVTPLFISAGAGAACVLVELLMDAPFHGRRGDEVTWRIEKWYYQKLYDAWSPFRTRCLYRVRASRAEWASWGWQFEPRLGGLDITYGMTEPVTVEYEIPARPTRSKGLAGTKYPPAEKARTW